MSQPWLPVPRVECNHRHEYVDSYKGSQQGGRTPERVSHRWVCVIGIVSLGSCHWVRVVWFVLLGLVAVSDLPRACAAGVAPATQGLSRALCLAPTQAAQTAESARAAAAPATGPREATVRQQRRRARPGARNALYLVHCTALPRAIRAPLGGARVPGVRPGD